MNKLSDHIEHIQQPLLRGEVKNFYRWAKQVEAYCAQNGLENHYAIYSNLLFRSLADTPRTYDHLSTSIYEVGNKLRSTLTLDRKMREFITRELSEADRKKLTAAGIPRPIDADIIIRGSSAVKAVAEINDLSHYNIKPNDVDGLIHRESSHTKSSVAAQYNSDPRGFRMINIHAPRIINMTLHNVDISLNQALLYADKVIYTEDCLETVITGTATISEGLCPVDIYGRTFREVEGQRVYTRKVYYRRIKAMIEGRIFKVVLPAYALDPENLKLIYNEKYTLFLVNQLRKKGNDEEGFQNLESILRRLGVLETDLSSHIEQISSTYPYLGEWLSSGTQQEANWMMKKYLHAIKDKQGLISCPPGYTITDLEMKTFSV